MRNFGLWRSKLEKHYGNRTDNLIASLKGRPRRVGFLSPWATHRKDLIAEYHLRELWRNLFEKRAPTDAECSALYWMNQSSAIAGHWLASQIQPHYRVLDMCSSPGGKALILAGVLHDTPFKLVLNEVDTTRWTNLKRVIREHLPLSLDIRNSDARTLQFPQKFDLILLDAPCKSDSI